MKKNNTTLVQVCVNPKTKATIYKPIEDCIIAYDNNGEEITLKSFLAIVNDNTEKMVNRIDNLEHAHNELVSKFNALLSAYKANVAKTAMQILDIEENK